MEIQPEQQESCMKVQIIKQIHVIAECPQCKAASHDVTHLLPGLKKGRPKSFGPWVCKYCLWSSRGSILKTGENEGDIEVSLEIVEQYRFQYDLLKLEQQEAPIYFVVKSKFPVQSQLEDPVIDLNFLYEEHQCPTNFIRCEAIVSQEDTDPHGLFKYIRSTTVPQEHLENSNIFSNLNFEEMNLLFGELLE